MTSTASSRRFEPCSVATDEFITRHIHLQLAVNFQTKRLQGSATLTVEARNPTAPVLHLDGRDLEVTGVTLEETGEQLKHTVADSPLGSDIQISLLPDMMTNGAKCKVKIDYSTSPSASAIQFLAPEQTAGKKQPFLFSQCQAIHARSMLPCQDTPAVKASYTATLTVPNELKALMSAASVAEADGDQPNTKQFSFEQKLPIPSYLIAIVVGVLESRDVSDRCRIWAEPEQIEASAWEFEQVDKMLSTGEELVGKYEWGRYDLLVLPPSFPYGGMENPMLTFVTPTLLAKDRSLVNVVAHEIAHSWTGNLVTNRTWRDFWLNEGFTVYIERAIAGRLHGEKTRQFEFLSGLKALKDSVDVFGHENPLTALCPNLDDGVDPDDAFSSVPYEKGSNLLYHLETKLGGHEVFLSFLKAYIAKFRRQSIATEDFIGFLKEYFADKVDVVDGVDWNAWLNAPGMPPVDNGFDTSLADQSIRLAQRWANAKSFEDFSTDDIKGLSSNQIEVFLDKLLEFDFKPSHALIEAMDKVYKFSASHNAEIRFRWQRVALKAGWKPIFPQVQAFVKEQGRMKFVRPLYRELFKCEGGADVAQQTFKQNRGLYHNIASAMIAKDLKLA